MRRRWTASHRLQLLQLLATARCWPPDVARRRPPATSRPRRTMTPAKPARPRGDCLPLAGEHARPSPEFIMAKTRRQSSRRPSTSFTQPSSSRRSRCRRTDDSLRFFRTCFSVRVLQFTSATLLGNRRINRITGTRRIVSGNFCR